MKLEIVAFLIGKLCVACSLSMLLPLILAIAWGDPCAGAFAASAFLAWLAGYNFNKAGEFREHDTITFREGAAVVSGAWVTVTFLGAMPYFLSGTLGFISSLFESISGFSTTGATTITNLTVIPHSLLFWRCMTHWMGGIGIVVWLIALLPNIGSGVANMYNAEVTGATDERLLPRIKNTSMALCKLYVVFTLLEGVLLYWAGMSFFDSVTHALSTIATGGFSTHDASVAYFNSPLIEGIIAVFMVLSGGNFAVYYSVGSKGIKTLWRDTEFRVYIFLVIFFTTAITLDLFWLSTYNGWESFRYAAFQVASIISTTGFVSNDFDVWPAFSEYLLVVLMFIGACAGSTAGGIKVSRVVVLCKMVGAEMKQILHPSMVTNISMNGKSLPMEVVVGISRFFFLYMFLFAILTLLLATTGTTVTDSIGIIAATMSSVGPALGIAGATCTYAPIEPFGKLVIAVAMLLGRLELFTLMVLIRPEFWRSTRNW